MESRRLNAAQHRLWFLERLNGPSGLYNEHASVQFSGSVNVPALCQAFADVVRRHESLRWRICEEDGVCVAVPRTERLDALQVIDLEAIADDATREAVYRACATEAARRPFDLSVGPLLRVLLLRRSRGEYAMTLVMHHIISDAWSTQILVEELCGTYRAICAGQSPAWPEVDYRHISEGREGDDPNAGEDRGLAYWTARLAGAPPAVSLPAHRARPPVRSFTGAKQYFTFDEATTAAVRARVREDRVTPFILLFALWTAYLGATAGVRDLVVGTTTAGRRRKAAERLIGFFANTLAIRMECQPHDSFRQHLWHVRTVLLEALDHQDVPFERVVRALPLPRSANTQPLFEVMFIYVNTPVLDLPLPGVTVRLTPEEIASGMSKFDIVIAFCDGARTIQGLIDYSTELYDGCEIGAHVARLQSFVSHALAQPDRPVRDLLPSDGVPPAVAEDLRSGSFVFGVPPAAGIARQA